MTSTTKILSRVRSLEAWANGLAEEATKIRKELERETVPAPRKGRREEIEAKVARAIARRNKLISKPKI